MNEFNATEYEEGGAQEGVVDLPTDESRDSDYEADDGREDFVDFQNDSDEDDSADIGEDAEDSDSDGAGRNSGNQSREENAAIRSARLRAEREARERAEAQANSDIAASGIINPYTKQPFKSTRELREYGEKVKRRQIEDRAKREGRSPEEVEEEILNREYITKMRKRSEASEVSTPSEDFLRRDVLDFVEKHPEFDNAEKLEALENNKAFREFCGSRFGREPLAELYDSYVSLVGRAGDAAVAKSISRSARSTGSGNDGGERLSPEQKRSLDRWNADNPDMQMTPKEFLSRR
ncbi:MAG: hypothetical protein IKV53_07265 [Clostridia bacterium]|nr:hypothetical protein [Clostridia bacterium]